MLYQFALHSTAAKAALRKAAYQGGSLIGQHPSMTPSQRQSMASAIDSASVAYGAIHHSLQDIQTKLGFAMMLPGLASTAIHGLGRGSLRPLSLLMKGLVLAPLKTQLVTDLAKEAKAGVLHRPRP